MFQLEYGRKLTCFFCLECVHTADGAERWIAAIVLIYQSVMSNSSLLVF